MDCCVRGYHIFKSFWDAPIGSILADKHEDDSQSLVHDKYDIALTNSDSVTVGHLPKFMSKLAHFFVEHDEEIRCEITGSNERIIEETKKKLTPLTEEYSKKH